MATPTSSRRFSRFQPQEDHETVVPTVSASVGHDHWANDVLNKVTNSVTPHSGSSGSNSPESSYCDGASDPGSAGVGRLLDSAEAIKAKVLEKKRKFHTGRCLELKNLPDGCVEQDIREAFSELGIVSVTIERHDGRYKASAKLTLEYPELLDEWPEARQNVFVRNKEVSVCVGNSDGWLCVAKLPLSYTDEEFFNLASAYGKVREAFLVVSERTAESKGYGLIKYVSSEAAAQARHLLDGRTVTGGARDNHSLYDVYKLDCDWLNSAHISYNSLHSKALYVDHLPPNFRDLTAFRKLFSVVKPPPYCQIAMPKGVIQDWGLVEFFNPQDTEETQKSTHLTAFHGRRIRVHYCIPGVNAINIYMQAVNAPPDTKKKALLQDTPTASVYSQLQKLAAQNPAFAQNLQNIIQEQIQTLSTGTSTSNAAVSASAAVLTTSASSNSTVTTSNASSSISNRPTAAASSTTNGLLYGVPPPPPPAAPVTAPTASSTTPIQSSSSINSNAQAALMILLTAQMQSQSGEPSLLQNPQVVSILQTLVNNAGSPGVASSVPSSVAAATSSSAPTTTDNKQNDINELLKDPSLASVFNRNEQQHQQSRPALLDTPKTTSRPILLGNAPNTENVLVDNSLLSNTQSLTQLLGVLSSEQQQPQKQPQQQQQQVQVHQPPPPVATQPTAPQSVQQQQALLANPPPTSYSGYYPASAATVAAPHQPQQRPVLLDGSSGSLMGFAPYSTNQFLLQPQQPPQQLYMQPQMLLQGFGPAAAASIQAQQAAYLGTPANMAISQFMVPTTTSGYIPTPIGYHPSSQQPPQHTFNNEAATPPQGHQQGLKRRLNIPPSPEQSPEGTYVGQHSQGIGGHYASSYFSKKAKKY